MTFNQKMLKDLQRSGKIRGFHLPEKKKGYSAGKNIVRKSSQRTKGLNWLGWNLFYWCKERLLTLKREHKFCDDRAFRFDFCIVSLKIAIEFEGGVFMENSGHNTAKHYTKDTEKYNRAAALGWRVVRCTALNYTTVLKTLNDLI